MVSNWTRTDAQLVSATIHAMATCVPKTKNASTSKKHLASISYVHHYQFVCLSTIHEIVDDLEYFEGRPKAIYANPCDQGAPLTDDISGAPVACALRSEDGTICPLSYECTAVPGSTQAVCCPKNEDEDDNTTETRPQTSMFPTKF